MKTPARKHGFTVSSCGTGRRRAVRVVGAAALHSAKHLGKRVAKRLFSPKSGSFTATKKVKKEEKETDAQHNDMSTIYLPIKLREPKKFEKSVGKWTMYHNYSGSFINGASGLQLVFEGNALCTAAQLTGAVVAAGTAQTSNLTWPQNPFDMNPFQTNTGSGVLTSVAKPVPDYVYLGTVDQEIHLTNFSTNSVEFDFSYLLCKKTTTLSCVGNWSASLINKGLGQAASSNATTLAGASLVSGYPQIATSGTGYGQAKTSVGGTYGIVPYTEKEFNMYWKKLHRRTFNLAPGSTKKIVVKIAYHKMFSKAYLTSLPANTIGIAGITLIPLIVVKPGPAIDNGVGLDCVTWAQAQVGQITQTKLNFMTPPAREARLEYNRYTGNVIQDSLISDLKNILDTDIVANVALTG